MLLCLVGHRLEVLNFLTKKKRKKKIKKKKKKRRGDEGEKRGSEWGKKGMYQIHYVHEIKNEKHQMK